MRGIVCGVLGIIAVMAARPAEAATIIFDDCQVAVLCNKLSMTTTLNGSAIDVSVTAPAGYGIFGDTGTNRSLGFNIAGSTIGVAFSNFSPGFEFGGQNVTVQGGYGFFEYLIDGPHGSGGALLPLSFTVTRTGGFQSDLDLFETNSTGFLVVAHLRNNTTGRTSFVASDTMPLTTVPEPATLLLFGTGLAAAVRARRPRR